MRRNVSTAVRMLVLAASIFVVISFTILFALLAVSLVMQYPTVLAAYICTSFVAFLCGLAYVAIRWMFMTE